MSAYKNLGDRLKNNIGSADFNMALAEAVEIINSLDAQKPAAWWYPKGEQFALAKEDGSRPFAKVWEPLFAAPVAAQPPSHSVIAGALFDFMGWLTTRKERLCLSSADDASPAVTAITEFAKMRSLSLDNAMVTDWQSGAAQASKPLSDAEIFDLAEPFGAFEFGDAQGDKRLAFARAAITAFCLKNRIKERG